MKQLQIIFIVLHKGRLGVSELCNMEIVAKKLFSQQMQICKNKGLTQLEFARSQKRRIEEPQGVSCEPLSSLSPMTLS